MRRRGRQWSQKARCHPRRTWQSVGIRAIVCLARCSRRLYSANLDPQASIALGNSPQRCTAMLAIVSVQGQLHVFELLPAIQGQDTCSPTCLGRGGYQVIVREHTLRGPSYRNQPMTFAQDAAERNGPTNWIGKPCMP